MSGMIIPRIELFVGIDMGQVNDSTAIAVIERTRHVPRENLHFGLVDQAREEAKSIPLRLDLVHMHPIPLGTNYPAQRRIITEMLHTPELRGVPVYVDTTGVGLGPFQFLKEEGLRNLHGINITGSTGPAKKTPQGWNVGKAELVGAVQIEMQTGRLRIGSRIPYADVLVHELKEFRVRQSAAGHLSFNAREGQHDDLVLATSYAVFGALRPTPVHSLNVRFAT
jgi:hypothetical protein